MTYIKKLEIQGFKSFAKKTVFSFPKGISCVIGSNGSGKSNVAEAICFVIGKSSKKELRAERLTDFIFNGGKKGKPAQFAKVKIIFDNSDGTFPYKEKELSITRTVSTKGSVYTINGERVTREEVLSVLAKARIDPDGHNIVLQGDIQKFVDLDPMQRRSILEEISGIAIYEDKKRKSLLNLQKVEEKIKEANIVLAEKKKLLQELEEQKKRAEEFRNSEIELRRLKASLLFKEIKDLEKKKDEIEKKIKELDTKVKSNEKQIEEYEKQITKNKIRIQEIIKETKDKGFEQASVIREKIIRLNGERDNLERELRNLDSQIKRAKEARDNLKKELANYKNELKLREKELNEVRDKINSLKEEIRNCQSEIQDATSGIKYKGLEAELKEIMERIYEVRGKLNLLEAKLNQIAELNDLELELKSKAKELKKIDLELEKKIDENTELATKQDEAEEEIRNIQIKLHNLKTKSKLSYDLLSAGVKEILKLRDAGKIKGIIGAVYELGRAEKKHSLALTVAAGSRILNIVVKNPDVAKKCIEHLKRRGVGKATFLPLNTLKDFKDYDESILRKEGVINYAINLVKFDPKYRKVFSTIFRDTLIVENFETAKRLGIGKYRMVTLDGDLFEISGAITGGSRDIEKLIGFKESIPEDEINELETKLEEYEKYLNKILVQRKENEKELIRLRETKARLSTEKEILEERISELKESTAGFSKREYNSLKVELKNLEKRREEIEKELKSKPDEKGIEELRRKEEELRLELENLVKRESELSSKIELSILRDISSLENSIRDSELQESKFEKMREELKSRLKDIISELNEQKKIEKKFFSSLEHLAKEQDKLELENSKLAEKIDKIRKVISDLQSKRNKLDLDRAKIVSKIEGLQEQLKDYSEIKIKYVKESVVELKTKISSLEAKVNALKQNVNLGAWETYKETEKEYKEISNKVQKLIDEKMKIQKVIDEIEARKREAFMETFNEINKYFDLFFKKLSPEGEAKLIIQNEEDIFSGGIDVLARPAGKKMVSMKSMSGGEKTITALAFIFAIQNYMPAPFYILDEVDAALDKANSQTLARLIVENSRYAQFIIITHNEEVISIADVLYGVYMDQNGSSQVVSLVLPKTKEDFENIKKQMSKKAGKI